MVVNTIVMIAQPYDQLKLFVEFVHLTGCCTYPDRLTPLLIM